MKQTATREEVERVLKEHIGHATSSIREILNELFGEPYEPKVGDWVVISVDNNNCSVNEIGDVGIVTHTFARDCKVDCGHNSNANHHNYENLRPATEEEIKKAQWKEGEVYEVWDNGCQPDEWYLAISSKDYGWFWINSKKKTTTQWTNFKRAVQC